ncbi:MAG: DUF2812 domain-containing protein [Lawsonibacter sp.]|nr:DUF2812 domain-containing protein [Lawsonibacter sp.]
MNVYQSTPVSLYNIQGLEGWLEEQARAGLFPLRITGDYTRFERREAAPHPRFRLEAANGRELAEPERLELYQQAGWQYFGKATPLYFLFYTLDPAAPELHTDPVTRGLSLEWLAGQVEKARRKQRIWRLVLLGLLVLGTVLIWQTDARRLPLYFLDMSGTALIFLLLFVWFWREEERDFHLLLDLQRSLELGLTPEPSRPRRWSRRSIPFWITIPLAILVLALVIADRLELFPIYVPLEDFSRPYVNLQQLESEPLLTYEELFHEAPHRHSGSSWGQNIAVRQFSFLAPSYYTVEQNLFSEKPGTKPNYFSSSGDPESRYSPTLEGVYFRLLIPAMARTMALSQLAQLELVNLTWTYEEVDWPGLDLVILSRSNSQYQGAAVCRGGRLAVFRYGGREDLANHLDILAAAVS